MKRPRRLTCGCRLRRFAPRTCGNRRWRVDACERIVALVPGSTERLRRAPVRHPL